MNPTLVWLGVGVALVVAELVTGTFYLLVLGLACLAGAAASFAGLNAMAQSLLVAVVAILGSMYVRRRHRLDDQPRMPSLDVGQSVRWESWIDQSQSMARVNYRGAAWDARVTGECAGQPDEMLYIKAVEGSLLIVSKERT